MLERSLGTDLGEGDLRHHRVLGEGRAAHEVADLLAVAREPHGAVGEVAEVLLGADRHAEVGARVDAMHALAALGREERHHVVAGCQRGDPLADLLDHAGALVAEDRRGVAGGIGAGGRVHVGVADAAGRQAHQHLAGAGLGQLHLLDGEGRPNSSRTAARIFTAFSFCRDPPTGSILVFAPANIRLGR